jgi:hypothetical protein
MTYEECRSNECRDGICRGSPCSCPGTSCADCDPGWRCDARDTDWVEKGIEHVVRSSPRHECFASCGACPLSTACDPATGLCKYVTFWDQPRVHIDTPDAGPYVSRGAVDFHATARARPGGAIVSYAWSTAGGDVAIGPSATFAISVDTSVTVTVTDDRGKTATAIRQIWPR